jgi:hypothetical protein
VWLTGTTWPPTWGPQGRTSWGGPPSSRGKGRGSLIDCDCWFTYLGFPRTYILAGSALFMREMIGKLDCRTAGSPTWGPEDIHPGGVHPFHEGKDGEA